MGRSCDSAICNKLPSAPHTQTCRGGKYSLFCILCLCNGHETLKRCWRVDLGLVKSGLKRYCHIFVDTKSAISTSAYVSLKFSVGEVVVIVSLSQIWFACILIMPDNVKTWAKQCSVFFGECIWHFKSDVYHRLVEKCSMLLIPWRCTLLNLVTRLPHENGLKLVIFLIYYRENQRRLWPKWSYTAK